MTQVQPGPVTVSDLTSQEAWKSFISWNAQNSSFTPKGGPVICNAPASKVFATVTDSSTYKLWSSFIPKVEIEPSDASTPTLIKPGTKIHFSVVMNPKKPQSFTPTDLLADGILEPTRPGETYYITWRATGFPQWLLFARRFWEIEDLEGGGSRVSTYEFQRGPLAAIVKMMYSARLYEALENDAKELAAFCERE